MTAIIINFQKAVALRNHRLGVVERVVKRKVINDCAESINESLSLQQIDFQQDNANFITNMRCRHSFFMYPSILANYRRGINPVAAIYNELQKTLFFGTDDSYCAWVRSLFEDKEWIVKLIAAVEHDNVVLSELLEKYKCFAKEDDYKKLKRMKDDFAAYNKVFSRFI